MSVPKTTEAMPSHYQALVENKLIFDSHGYVKRMTDGGFNEQQAETLAAEQAELLNNLATRQDIDGVRKDMRNMATKQDLELLEANLRLAMKEDKVEMIKFMTWYFLSSLAVMAAMMTAMTAVIKLT